MYQGENFNNHEELLETGDVRLGLVANCKKLNVREIPALDAPIICEIVCQTKLMVEEVDSTEDFYKVCTVAGIEGFCMKKVYRDSTVKEDCYGEYTDIDQETARNCGRVYALRYGSHYAH